MFVTGCGSEVTGCLLWHWGELQAVWVVLCIHVFVGAGCCGSVVVVCDHLVDPVGRLPAWRWRGVRERAGKSIGEKCWCWGGCVCCLYSLHVGEFVFAGFPFLP